MAKNFEETIIVRDADTYSSLANDGLLIGRERRRSGPTGQIDLDQGGDMGTPDQLDQVRPKSRVLVGGDSFPGGIYVHDGQESWSIAADGPNGGLKVGNQKGTSGTVTLFGGSARGPLIELDAARGVIEIRNDALDVTVAIDGREGDIYLHGADCAEDMETCAGVGAGDVLVVGKDGRLAPCDTAYDTKVAGVVSGTEALRPGLRLGKGTTTGSHAPIALVGRVMCKVDARTSTIEPGDLLTTSSHPGHAQRLDDRLKGVGAILGKSMGFLSGTTGELPILVALQ